MERTIVKPVISRKHIWEKTEDGEVDLNAYCDDFNFHNGPYCVVCNSVFCIHCEPDYDSTLCKPHYICPECGTVLSEEHEEKYCMECGVKLDWSEVMNK
ncbi:MAG: hypothetical protein Q4D26_10475 [Clostridia bacterium]|nr:hypothetical protein [Clostridia bacterium]